MPCISGTHRLPREVTQSSRPALQESRIGPQALVPLVCMVGPPAPAPPAGHCSRAVLTCSTTPCLVPPCCRDAYPGKKETYETANELPTWCPEPCQPQTGRRWEGKCSAGPQGMGLIYSLLASHPLPRSRQWLERGFIPGCVLFACTPCGFRLLTGSWGQSCRSPHSWQDLRSHAVWSGPADVLLWSLPSGGPWSWWPSVIPVQSPERS